MPDALTLVTTKNALQKRGFDLKSLLAGALFPLADLDYPSGSPQHRAENFLMTALGNLAGGLAGALLAENYFSNRREWRKKPFVGAVYPWTVGAGVGAPLGGILTHLLYRALNPPDKADIQRKYERGEWKPKKKKTEEQLKYEQHPLLNMAEYPDPSGWRRAGAKAIPLLGGIGASALAGLSPIMLGWERQATPETVIPLMGLSGILGLALASRAYSKLLPPRGW